MSTRRECDVVVIGVGAAGGLLATLLAERGMDVVGLEAGPRHDKRGFALDDVDQLGRNILGAAKVNHEVPTVRTTADEPAERVGLPFGMLMMNGVGGSKTHSANVSWRLLPWNFEARSRTVARYGPSAVPDGSTIVDWPLCYDELAPYYDLLERYYGVAGRAGNVRGTRDPAGNVYEGERGEPYPSPPLRSSAYTRMMAGAARALGWDAFPVPASIRTVDDEHGLGCRYCGFCMWNGCWADAKRVPAAQSAETSSNLNVLTDARVTEIQVDRHGRASGVAFVTGRERWVQPAKLVVVATYTYENVRLLLLSSSAAFPNGLANNSGQVGRHFMTHTFLLGFGLFPGRELNAWTGALAQATAVDEFDGDNFDHGGLGFIGGSALMASMEARVQILARATPPSIPRWGAVWKDWLAENLRSVAWAYTLPDVLPYETNFLDLDPTARDRHGVPVIRVTYDFRENEHRQVDYLKQQLDRWFRAAGATETWDSGGAPSPISTHAYGGTRMGTDPSASVVNPWGVAHEVPNLAVLGASCFPTSGGLNPTETVEALTWRTADHLAAEWERIAR